MVGTVSVVDECVTFGPKLVNPILTLSPGALSTWQPPHNQFYSNYDYFMIGERWEDPAAGLGDFGGTEEDGISPLNVKDLACPTWGLGQSLSAGTTVLTIGPPWLPLIVPPREVLSLDPTWASSCTGIFTGANGFTTFQIFDPPIALTPSAWLVDPTPTAVPTPADPTTISEQTTPSAKAAKPEPPPDPAAPASNTRGSGTDPTPPPVVASADPIESVAPHGSSVAYPKNQGDPPTDPPANPVVVGNLPAGDPNGPSSKSSDPPPGDSQNSPPDHNPPAVPVPPKTRESQAQAQGLGAIIYNAFGKSRSGNSLPTDNNDNDDVDNSPVTQNTLTIAGQELMPDPSGIAIGGSRLLPGGSAVTISNTPISLGSSGILVVGSSTTSLATPAQLGPPFIPAATKALTVAGQTFTPNPSAFSIAGSAVVAGGNAVTISNTPVSLGSLGILVVGSSTMQLPTHLDPPSIPFATKVLTVAGQTFTPNPFAFPIAGTTLSAGGPAITVSGTVVSLGPSGAVVIGSSTVSLPSTYTVAGQTFTLLSSAIAIAGTTISVGGLAATVDGTIISLQTSDTLIVGSSTIPLSISQSTFSPDVNVDGFDVEVSSAFAVVDGKIVRPGAAGVTISGEVISLEAGGETLDIGTGRFALQPMQTEAANGSINVQAFTGESSGDLRFSPILLCGFYGTLMLLLLLLKWE